MKECKMCGCLMPDNHEGDICECCLDEYGDRIPDGIRGNGRK